MRTRRRLTRLRTVALSAGAVAALGLVAVASWRWAPRTSAGPCAVTLGPVALPQLAETSGLAIGRRQPVIWTHNDSGNDADLVAVDEAGRQVARLRLPVTTRDWEDVSAAPCPGGDCLYVADIGDNARKRRRVFVHRLPEPGPGATATEALQTFALTYPDGPHNAEGLFLLANEAFVVTKDRRGTVYRTGPLPDGGGEVGLIRVGELGLEMVTDAEASTDGRSVIVRTAHVASLHRASDLQRGDMRPYATIPLGDLRESQGEGAAMRGDAIYLSSEAGAFGRDGSLLRLQCRLPSP